MNICCPKDESQEETSAKAKSEEEMRPIAAEAYRRESRRFDPEAVPSPLPNVTRFLCSFGGTLSRSMEQMKESGDPQRNQLLTGSTSSVQIF